MRMMAHAVAVTFPAAVMLAGCQPGQDGGQTPVDRVSAAPPRSDAHATAPTGPLSVADLRRVCRAGLASVHGQTVDAIQVDGVSGGIVDASWRAPVDGGRMRAQCRVDGDLITYRPVDRPVAQQNRWMNRSGDPAVRFALDGSTVAITTTLADGTASTGDYAVPVSGADT